MRPDEWLFPVDNDRVITADEADGAPVVHPDVALISDYLIGDLDPASRADVERRFADDEGFRTRVAPILAAWNHWPTVREIEIPEAEIAASWQRVLMQLAQPDEETQEQDDSEPADTFHDPRPHYPPHDRTRHLTQVRRLRLLVGASLIGLAASLTFIAVDRQRQANAPQTHIVTAPTVESHNIHLRPGGQIQLGPASRLSWSDTPDANHIYRFYLDGSATFELPHLTSGRYVVVTRAAEITVTGTQFTVEMDDTNATRVRVTQGQVMVSARGAGIFDGLFLEHDESAIIVRGQPPRRVP